MSKTIVFFGNERLATGVTTSAPTLQGLVSAGYKVSAIIAHGAATNSRLKRELEIEQVAKTNDIPLILPNKLKGIKDQLFSFRPTIGVLVAYGQIVPQEIIDIFPKGIVNIHPSLLPKHRGPTPLESVILEGATYTGVSLMSLAKTMDSGPIYAQSELALSGQETKQQLADQLLDIGSSMLLELLPGIIDGSVSAIKQDESSATYDSLIRKEDALIDWSKPAQRLEREVRAYATWPQSRTSLYGKDVIITKIRVVDQNGNPGKLQITKHQLIIYCGHQALEILELKPAGKAAMSAKSFIAGLHL
jgi:methionyl-tRNA formyltransferase